MDAYRKSPIPVIYTELGFVRAAPPSILADCPKDLPRLQLLQSVARGQSCVSELERSSAFERSHWLIVKAELPNDIFAWTGNTWKVIEWRVYFWKLYDAEFLVNVSDPHPAEARSLADAGINTQFLNSLAHPTSCLPMLRETQKLFGEGYKLRQETAVALERIETPLIARLKFGTMKQLKPAANSRSQNVTGDPQISPSLRDTILRRGNYRCLFCGQDSSTIALEVNHVIPRNLINKLHLASALHTATENLCVTCRDCNRGKCDNLRIEDIEYYRSAFSSQGHPNHDLLPHLTKLSELQAL